MGHGTQVSLRLICGRYLRPRMDGLGLKPLVRDLALSRGNKQRDLGSAAAACPWWVNAMSAGKRERCTLQRMFHKSSWRRSISQHGECRTALRLSPALPPINYLLSGFWKTFPRHYALLLNSAGLRKAMMART